MTVQIIQGDALARLRELPSDHFHCIVTSPPYWNLRDYGVEGQIGLEETPEQWCARLVEVFREVRRVLRPDGVLWLNCGDSYASSPTGDLKLKDLIGQPWMLAFALRADGWWLRSEIIWAKPNSLPESVRDRPTKAHEQVFLLTKSPRYFYDAEAVREPGTNRAPGNITHKGADEYANGSEWHRTKAGLCEIGPSAARNLRSVWTIATEPLPSIVVDGEKLDHFASYPTELARRCILAGTSAKGCCPACGAPWARVVEREFEPQDDVSPQRGVRGHNGQKPMDASSSWQGFPRGATSARTTGWRPTCACDTGEPIPCRVLDPFGGSGRTALAADELGRDCTLIELNPASCRMAQAQVERARARRYIGDAPHIERSDGQLGLFDEAGRGATAVGNHPGVIT